MKKALVVLAVFGALALAASPALAVPAILGPNWSAHFTDGSSNYVDGVPRAPFGGPTPSGFAPTTVAIGDENRSIFNVDTFLQGGSPYALIPAGQLTGLAYDLKLDFISGDPVAGTATLYYTALGRNPIVAGALDGDEPVGSGGVLEIYNHTAGTGSLNPIFNPNSDAMGPQAWATTGDLTGTPNHAVAADGYPNINGNAAALANGASLYLQGVFVPIGLDPLGNPTLLQETIDLSNLNGTSFLAYIDITGGFGAGSFVKDFFGPGKDLSLADTFALPGNAGYDGGPVAAGSWQIESSDPVRGAPAIPEPATMTLLGLGIAGLVARIRRS